MINSLYEAYKKILFPVKGHVPENRKKLSFLIVLGVTGIFFSVTTTLVIKYYQEYRQAFSAANNWTFDTAGSYSYDSNHINISSSIASHHVPWWDSNYAGRKVLKLTNTSSEDLAAGMPVMVTVDTYSLSSVRSDCNDARLVYYNGSSNTELNRSYQLDPDASDCTDSTATIFTFPLQAALSASSTTDAYYLYYNYSSASAPSNTDSAYDVGSKNNTFALMLRSSLVGAAGETASTSSGPLRYGGQKSALVFDGYNDYARIADSANLDIADHLTLESWIYPLAVPSSDAYLVYRANAYYLKLDTSRHLVGGIWNGSDFSTATSSASVALNSYTHVAMTFDASASSNQIKLWINGSQDGTGTDTTTIPATNTACDLGSNGGSNGYYGYLDEVRLSTTIRYYASFTPTTAPFESDEYTAVLIHGDEYGSTDLYSSAIIDSSSNATNASSNGTSYSGGLIGIDRATSAAGKVPSTSYAAHDGLLIEPTTTNLVTNPSFEYATYDNGWTASTLSASDNTSTKYIRFGVHSAKLDNSGNGSAGTFLSTIDPNTTQVSLSAWVYNGTSASVGGTVDSSVAQLYYDSAVVSSPTPTYTDMGGGWWRIQAQGMTVSDASKSYGIQVSANTIVYLDAMQLETQAMTTTYCDGSLGSGYSWNGTAHASTSTRASDVVEFAVSNNISSTLGTLTLWIKPMWDGDDNLEHVLLDSDTSSGTFKFYKNSSNQLILDDGTNTSYRDVSSMTKNQWYFVAAIWGSNNMQVYVNGATGTAAGAYSPATLGTYFYLGQDNSNTAQADAIISQVVIYDVLLANAEVADMYARGAVSQQAFIPNISNTAVYPPYTLISAFSETTGGSHSGSINYQLSPDGTNWYFYNSSNWIPVSKITDYNTASTINSNISTFPDDVSSGNFYFQAFLEGSSPELDTLSITYANAPSPPTDLYANDTSAQAGQTNPVDLTDTTPAFSALFQDDDSSDKADKARIQVSTDNTFESVTHWDSGASGSAISEVTVPDRSSDIIYNSLGDSASQSLSLDDGSTTYYWRIKFWDVDAHEGQWSSAASFAMQDSPAAPSSAQIAGILSDQMTISWTDNSSGQSQEENFEIQHSTNGVDYGLLQTNDADDTDYDHSGLSPDTIHYYQIRATNTAGNSSYTSAVSAYTAANIPGAPVLSIPDYEIIHFILDENSNPSTVQYAIAVSTDNFVSDTKYVQNDNTLGDTLGEEDWLYYADWGGASGEDITGLTQAQEYTFKVKARNSDALETAYSNTTQITTWTNPSLSLTVEGTSQGTVDLTGLNDTIPFGYAIPGVPLTAVQKISITTNATSGYTILVKADAKMTLSDNPSVDVDFVKNGAVGTNTAPVSWASPSGTEVGVNTASIGYHTSDALLGTGTVDRFAAADSWAGFDTIGQYYEILYLNGPTSGEDEGEEYCHMTFKLETNNLHPSGNYTDLVLDYKIVPIF